jgi:hypothetical protein
MIKSIAIKLHLILLMIIVGTLLYMFLIYKNIKIIENDVDLLKAQMLSVLPPDVKGMQEKLIKILKREKANENVEELVVDLCNMNHNNNVDEIIAESLDNNIENDGCGGTYGGEMEECMNEVVCKLNNVDNVDNVDNVNKVDNLNNVEVNTSDISTYTDDTEKTHNSDNTGDNTCDNTGDNTDNTDDTDSVKTDDIKNILVAPDHPFKNMTLNELSSQKYDYLKSFLKDYGESVKGTKVELAKRILEILVD